jgi:hypothetical protein
VRELSELFNYVKKIIDNKKDYRDKRVEELMKGKNLNLTYTIEGTFFFKDTC